MEDWRSHSAAVPLNFQPLRSNLSINLLNMHDSVPVLSVSRYTRGTRGGREKKKNISDAAAVCDANIFYSAMIQGYSMSLKTIATTVIQTYSNSLRSQSVQTPKKKKKCCHHYKPFCFLTNAKLFLGNTKVWPVLFQPCNFFFVVVFCWFFFVFFFCSQMIQLKCVKMMKEIWNEDPFPKQASRPA